MGLIEDGTCSDGHLGVALVLTHFSALLGELLRIHPSTHIRHSYMDFHSWPYLDQNPVLILY